MTLQGNQNLTPCECERLREELTLPRTTLMTDRTAAHTSVDRHAVSDTLVKSAPMQESVGVTVTVAISTRNRGALIAETLQTLLEVQYESLEIVIVDQSTNDVTRRTVEEVAADDPRVRYIASTTVGLPAGRNLGARLSRAEIVAYTDDDCIVTQEWLEAIVDEFSNSKVAAVYGRLLPYEYRGRTGTDVGLKDSLERLEYTGKILPWYVGHGGNMAFRRSALLDVGGFDPLLGAGSLLKSGEDSDMTYRLLAAGKRLVYSPRALAYHKHWKNWREQTAMERAYGVGAGAQFAKYIRCGDPWGLRLILTWTWHMGVRRFAAGLLKWHSLKVMYLGYCQLVYPWIGVWQSRRFEIDQMQTIYLAPPDRRAVYPSVGTA